MVPDDSPPPAAPNPFSVNLSLSTHPATDVWPRVFLTWGGSTSRLAGSLGQCGQAQEDEQSQLDPLSGTQNPVHREITARWPWAFEQKGQSVLESGQLQARYKFWGSQLPVLGVRGGSGMRKELNERKRDDRDKELVINKRDLESDWVPDIIPKRERVRREGGGEKEEKLEEGDEERVNERRKKGDRRKPGPKLPLGPIPSTAAPCPKLPRSFWIFTIIEATQTFPHPTLLPELLWVDSYLPQGGISLWKPAAGSWRWTNEQPLNRVCSEWQRRT